MTKYFKAAKIYQKNVRLEEGVYRMKKPTNYRLLHKCDLDFIKQQRSKEVSLMKFDQMDTIDFFKRYRVDLVPELTNHRQVLKLN